MADKPIMIYTVRQQPNRATGGVIYVPAIVEREDSIPLDEIVRRAIDRNLIAGLKVSAAASVADGVARQMFEELKQGNGVKFGNYFYARVYLDGTTDGNGTLTQGRNGINVRLYKGEGFKLALSDFAWQNVDGGNIPGIDYLISDVYGAVRDMLKPDATVLLNGTALCGEADDSQKVVFTQVLGEGDEGDPQVVEVADFIAKGPNLLSFAWPAALVAGRTYSVQSQRLRGGATYISNSHVASVEDAE